VRRKLRSRPLVTLEMIDRLVAELDERERREKRAGQPPVRRLVRDEWWRT
jgi:hypothetical protein